MKRILHFIPFLALKVTLFILSRDVNAQVINASYKNRIVNLQSEGNPAQQGFIIGERNNRLYIVTVFSGIIKNYSDDIVAVISDGQKIKGRWYKDGKAIEAAGLMVLSIPKPANFRLNKLTYYTRAVQGQSVSMQLGNNSKPIALRIGTSLDSTISLNPASVFIPSDDLIGAPVYLPDKGLIGIISSVSDVMLQAIRVSSIRDAIRKDENELFDPTPLDKELDELIVVKSDNPAPDTHSNKTAQGSVDPYPGGKTPTVSEVPDKVHRLRFGVGFGVNFLPKPASPAYDNQNKLTGYVSFTINYSLFRRLVLHTDPHWNKYQIVLAKDSKYANYALTKMYLESVMIPAGFDYHFSNKPTTFFLRLDGAVSKTLYGNYEYTFNGKTDRVILKSNQMTWQKAAILGLGAKSKGLRILATYYYAFDPFINDNELTNTVPRVTPFKQQQTSLKYVSLELGLYF